MRPLPYLLFQAAAFSVLIGCAARQPAGLQAGGEPAIAIQAFETVCLKTAPTFSGAAEAAGAFGITRFDQLGPARMGMAKDGNLGVQIKLGGECAITTPTQADRTLGAQFGAVIAHAAGGNAPSAFPAVVTVGGQPFIFQHDRQGGEAFVMLTLSGKGAGAGK